jgi:hypothetical protein
LLKKFQPLPLGVCLGGVSDDFALQIIQRWKEGNRTVAIVRFGCGYALQTRCTVALETPNSRAIERQVHRAWPCGGRVA